MEFPFSLSGYNNQQQPQQYGVGCQDYSQQQPQQMAPQPIPATNTGYGAPVDPYATGGAQMMPDNSGGYGGGVYDDRSGQYGGGKWNDF